MKAAIYVLIVLASLSEFVYSQADPADEKEIRTIISLLGKAFVSRESAPFEKYYRDDYVNIRTRPVFNAKAQLLALVKADSVALKAGKSLDFQTISYTSDKIKVHLFGQAAIVTSYRTNNWKYRQSKCLTRYQMTELWLKDERTWRLASGHSTQYQCDPMPWMPLHPSVAAIPSQEEPAKSVRTDVESAIRSLIAAARNSDAVGAFTENYVSTDIDGKVSTERQTLVNAIATVGRHDETLYDFGEAVLYTFRIRPRTPSGESAGVVQCSAILVSSGGQWRFAAFHMSKPSG